MNTISLEKLKNKTKEVQDRYLQQLTENNMFFLFNGYLCQNPSVVTEDEILEKEYELRLELEQEGLTDTEIEPELQSRFWIYVTTPKI